MASTAVDFLVQELRNGKELNDNLIKQANEMFEQQIMKAVYDSMGTNFDPNMGRAELYYNETFKSE
jgi:hypothetical protein